MPVYYGNANYRRKYDAFRIVDESQHDPLKEAIKAALELTDAKERVDAWTKVAEFIYAKQKHIEGVMNVEHDPLEQLSDTELEQLIVAAAARASGDAPPKSQRRNGNAS